VHIDDIAHALSMQCRFNGHCNRFYSVAQHSVHVAEICRERECTTLGVLGALLHDAAEAYTGDLVRPLKMLLPGAYERIERQAERAVSTALMPHGARVGGQEAKRADMIMLATEARDLMGVNCARYWESIAGVKPREERITPLQPNEARRLFLSWYDDLYTQLAKERMP